MNNPLHLIRSINLHENIHTKLILLFLFLLGSHWLDYSLLLFVFASFFLIQGREIRSKEFLLLLFFILSVYITWIIIDKRLLHDLDTAIRLFPQGAMILVAYLLGSSINITPGKQSLSSEKTIFYILFIFFIAYTISIIYSYFMIPQDKHLTPDGIFVCFMNEYKRLNVHEGRLISTIMAYYLTFMAVVLPLILLYFKAFRQRNFYYTELLLLTLFALFAIYISNETGRRTVLLLLVMTFVYLALYRLTQYIKGLNIKTFLLTLTIFIAAGVAGYYMIADTEVANRIMTQGFHDRRFNFWVPGLQAMIDYPVGGGHGVLVAHDRKLAHNTWIDIGKDFGVIPFITIVLFFLMHIPYLIRILSSHNISIFIKHQFLIIFIGIIAILMVEPVFTSDKTFFAYTVFFLGYLKQLYTQTKQVSLSP